LHHAWLYAAEEDAPQPPAASSEEHRMSTVVPLLDAEQVARLPKRAREVIEYRKSGLSLNHIQGCPLDCAYCIRHTYGLWDQRQPRALMSNAEAVAQLVSHRYFQPHLTPLQLFNRATDPFLPAVRPHTFAVLEDLDQRGYRNHVLVITRHAMKPDDAERLNRLTNLKVTLLFTYSGIEDARIEPYPSSVAAKSLKLMSAPSSRRYRTVLYWRPLVPGLNDSDTHFDAAYELHQHADATVFTGLFYRDQIAAYYRANGLPEPYDVTARRKIVPETLEQRILAASQIRPRCSARPRARCHTSTNYPTTTDMSASANSVTSVRLRSLTSAVKHIGYPLPSKSTKWPARCPKRMTFTL
jgi:DNA repair photolyase